MQKIYALIWRFYTKWLPIYLPIGGYVLAIWNCGFSSKDGKYLNPFTDLRITLRKDGEWMLTFKKGDHNDLHFCSKEFRPFGINLRAIFENMGFTANNKTEQ